MALTHYDAMNHGFLARLKERALEAEKAKASVIAAGSDVETELARWKSNGVEVRHLPDDEQGILRISIGGGRDTPIPLDYCTIRGSVGKCIELLERALKALKDSPE